MRLTLVASLVLCGFCCAGCESLRKTAHRWPGKAPEISEQLANDQQRREATEKQIAQGPPGTDLKTAQQANFAPDALSANDPSGAILLQAKQAEQARQNQVAKSLYEQVLQQQPQHPEAHHRLGVLADQEGRYPEAQQHYQLALQQQPRNASLQSDIGYSLFSQDRLDEAEQYLHSALQLQPENQYARNNLAQVYGRRAQQTGSPNDYKLAQEQFTLALGPQGAEQQMQQLFPQARGAAGERRGLLNPFKKLGSQEKNQNRLASNLEAPDLQSDSGNAALIRQMDQIRAQMIANGELPPKPPVTASVQRPPATNSPLNVPFDQMNNVLSQIDQDAANRQAMALRRGYPNRPREANSGTQDDWTSMGGVEPAAAWNDPNPGVGSRSFRQGPDGNVVGPNDRFSSSMPIVSGPAGQPAGRDQFGAPVSGQTPNSAGNRGPNQYASPPRNVDPTDSQGWDQGGSGMSQSWPDRLGSPTQFDARGQTWDGQSLMNNPVAGNSANPAYEANDPTYYSGTGRSFGIQRPNGLTEQGSSGQRSNRRGRPGNTTADWDDGRQTAAQLGLDAGMGEMFPGDAGDPGMYEQNQPGNRIYPAGGVPSIYGNPTNQRGLPPNGSRNVAPANFDAMHSGYENHGYVDPAWGENYGNQRGDGGAPWNQPGMNSRTSRPASQMQYGNDGSQAQGRFAPSRQTSPPSPDFGAPPMYYGR